MSAKNIARSKTNRNPANDTKRKRAPHHEAYNVRARRIIGAIRQLSADLQHVGFVPTHRSFNADEWAAIACIRVLDELTVALARAEAAGPDHHLRTIVVGGEHDVTRGGASPRAASPRAVVLDVDYIQRATDRTGSVPLAAAPRATLKWPTVRR